MAFTGHSATQTAQSMHSSGSMTRKLGPTRKQSTGHTSTQSVYRQRMQDSVTTWVITFLSMNYFNQQQIAENRWQYKPAAVLQRGCVRGFSFSYDGPDNRRQ